jgi:hypothetical protein
MPLLSMAVGNRPHISVKKRTCSRNFTDAMSSVKNEYGIGMEFEGSQSATISIPCLAMLLRMPFFAVHHSTSASENDLETYRLL